jgi:hypothetical protein
MAAHSSVYYLTYRWTSQGTGRWRSEAGRVLKEREGKWWGYPGGKLPKVGPYTTLWEAADEVERIHQHK